MAKTRFSTYHYFTEVGVNINDYDCMTVSEGLALQVANGVLLDTARDFSAVVDDLCIDKVCSIAKAVAYNGKEW